MKYIIVEHSNTNPTVISDKEGTIVFDNYYEAYQYSEIEVENPLILPLSSTLVNDLRELYFFLNKLLYKDSTNSLLKEFKLKLQKYIYD